MKNIIPKSKLHFLLLKMLLVLTLMLNFFGCNTFAADLTYLDLPETVKCEYQGYEPEHKEEMYIGKRSISRIIKDNYARLLFTGRNNAEYVLLIPMHKYPYSKSIWLDQSKNKESVSLHNPVKVIFNPPGEKGIRNIMALLPPESWQGYPSVIVLYNDKNEERIYVAYRKGPGNDDISWSIADATELHKNLPKVNRSWKPAYSPTSIKDKCAPHSYYNSVAFSPDGKYALSGSSDRAVKLWDIKSGKKIRVFSGHTDNVRSVAFCPDGRNIISGGWDGTVRLWDVNSGSLIRTFKGHRGYIYSVAFSPDGQHILSGSWDDTMKLWDTESGNEIRTFQKKSSHHYGRSSTPIDSIAISPNGLYALAGNTDDEVSLWEIGSGNNIRTFLGHNDMYINSVAFSPNSQYALSGGNDQTMKIWEVSSGWEIKSLEQNAGYVYSVAFSPDGRYVLSGNENGLLLLWELATSRLIRTFKGHSGSVQSVAFSPDGRLILSGSEDETLKLWDVESGTRIRTFIAEPEEVPSKCKKDSSINTSNTSPKQQAETKYEKEKVIKRKNQKLSLEMPSFDCFKESYNNMKSMDANCFKSLIDKIILYLSKDCRYQFSAFQSFPQITPSEDCQQEFKVALQEKIPQVQECYQAPANAKCKEQMDNYFVRGVLGPDNCTKAMERLVKICGDDLSSDEKCYKDNWSDFETACSKE
ncbi:MAG: WD40 repeat domain-containing protein [Syntrophaceae bacterium]|nr:WD40 repeat domain-containing protein [Syntrophaceae bacterium]